MPKSKSDMLIEAGGAVWKLLQTRTGIFGWGPTYGELLLSHTAAHVERRRDEKSVVRGAEEFLADINERNKRLI